MLLRGKSSEVNIRDKLQKEKERIRAQVEEQLVSSLELELREYERSQESKTAEFNTVYEEDNRMKVTRYQTEK